MTTENESAAQAERVRTQTAAPAANTESPGEKTQPADGQYTTNGRPHGWTSLTPHIVVSPATEALTFYQEVFGAKAGNVTKAGDIVVHADIDFGEGRMTLCDPMESYHLVAPGKGEDVSSSLALYVPNVDDVVSKAVGCGATLREPVSTFVSGDRYGSILDPFGIRWAIMTRVEDLSEEESAKRVEEWAATQQQ